MSASYHDGGHESNKPIFVWSDYPKTVIAPLHFVSTEVLHILAAAWAVWMQLHGIMFSIKARYFGELGVRDCMDQYIAAYCWQSCKWLNHLEFKCNKAWHVSEDVYTKWNQTVQVAFDTRNSSMETIGVSMSFEEQIIAGGGYCVIGVFSAFCVITLYSFIFVFSEGSFDFRRGSYLVAVWRLKQQRTYRVLAFLCICTVFLFILFVVVLFCALDWIGNGDTLPFILQNNLFAWGVMFMTVKKFAKTLNVVSDQDYDLYKGQMFYREYSGLLETNDEFAIRLLKHELSLREEQFSRAVQSLEQTSLEDTSSKSLLSV